MDASRALGRLLAENGIRLVYGGGNRGLMGTLADTVKSSGGNVLGVLPRAMDLPCVRTKDVETELIIADDMHDRKRKMYDAADAFVVLPGGIGTMDEFFEIFTWKQLGYHKKPVALLNISGFYDTLLKFLDEATEKGFVSRPMRDALIVLDSTEGLIDALEKHEGELPSKL